MQRFFLALLLVVGLGVWVRHAQAQSESTPDAGWLLTTQRTNGQSDIWAIPANGGTLRPLTTTPDDERHPAFHPDGHTIAYAARRERNWDIYALDLRTGTETRLTTNPHFEGYPAWSPDGTRLAFASMREGELDVFVLDLESNTETNVTSDSLAHDFEPHWEDNNTLLFVSTRTKSLDVFRLRLGNDAATAVIESPTQSERDIQLVENGLMAIVQNGREVELQRFSRNGTAQGDPFSWSDTVINATVSPNGEAVAWLEFRYDGLMLYQQGLAADSPIVKVAGPFRLMEGLTWGQPDSDLMEAQLANAPTLSVTPTVQPQTSSLVWVDNLETLQPEISQRTLESFTRLRGRIAGEVGFDFLGEISESVRPVDWESDGSDYMSWHKAGRAIDTLLDAGWRGGYPIIELVREDRHDDVYWRFWIRCASQDGSCGEPLTDAPWDFSYEARWEVAPGQGGINKPFLPGYYVNFTRYAEEENWERISSYEAPDFDWRETNIAAEFWHYQYTNGLKWHQAMQEILTTAEMEEYFGWSIIRERNEARWRLNAKGVPLPSDIRNVPVEVVIP